MYERKKGSRRKVKKTKSYILTWSVFRTLGYAAILELTLGDEIRHLAGIIQWLLLFSEVLMTNVK
jgi:hypothetical protein